MLLSDDGGIAKKTEESGRARGGLEEKRDLLAIE